MALRCGKLRQNKTERAGVQLDETMQIYLKLNLKLKFILNYIPFPDPPTLPCSVWKFLFEFASKKDSADSTNHSSGRMLGRVFQTAFCRARQPRYHAVDETEAVHKHGGAFSAWSCSRTSFRCRTTLYEFKLHRRGGLWNGLVRRVLSSLSVSFSQQFQMRFAPSKVVRFCSFESNNFFILALFLFNTQLRFE